MGNRTGIDFQWLLGEIDQLSISVLLLGLLRCHSPALLSLLNVVCEVPSGLTLLPSKTDHSWIQVFNDTILLLGGLQLVDLSQTIT